MPQTEFELWFETDWAHLLESEGPPWYNSAFVIWKQQGGVGNFNQEVDSLVVPDEAWTTPMATGNRKPADHSWDRRAAYLVYGLLRSRGLTLNAASDLFA